MEDKKIKNYPWALSFLAFVVLTHTLVGHAATYSGSAGMAAESYRIANAADWTTLTNTPGDWNEHFILTADIHFGGAALTPVENYFTSFTDVFDGNNRKLRNTVINLPAFDYVGLFGYVGRDGVIRNLVVENVAVTGRSSVGGPVGTVWYGRVEWCYATGGVSGVI